MWQSLNSAPRTLGRLIADSVQGSGIYLLLIPQNPWLESLEQGNGPNRDFKF